MKKKRYWLIFPGIILLAFLLWTAVFYLVLHNRVLDSRPLVLIQKPLNHDEVKVGEGILVHATARSGEGVKRVELWVDGLMTAESTAVEETPSSQLVISAAWVPPTPGSHTLTVRAYSQRGVEGQSSIEVLAFAEAGGEEVTTRIMLPGETLASIAVSEGVPMDELMSLNPGVGSENMGAPDTLTIPRDPVGGSADLAPEIPERETAEAESPPLIPGDESPPPVPGDEAPGSLEAIFDLPSGLRRMVTDPMWLTVEVLSLTTPDAYESLHCYASLANRTPYWVPDADFNQSTDESFKPSAGGHSWNIARHMSGDQALRLYWDMNDAVPLSIDCVGILGGGLDSVRLGSVREEVPPEYWGMTQTIRSSGGEGEFIITARVNWQEKGPDSSITPPWNVRLDEDRRMLLWDYLSVEDGGQAVDGFAILLNGTLQWVEPKSARQTRIPGEWFIPPCGDQYDFVVIAFQYDYPVGNYSLDSNIASVLGDPPGSETCGQEIMLTFERLIIGELPGDPDPVYGMFYVDEETISFDGRPEAGGSFPITFGLDDGLVYNIREIMHGFGEGFPRFIHEIKGRNVYEDRIVVGFEIYKGSNLVCAGHKVVSENRLAGRYEGLIETYDPLGSAPDWCRVAFTSVPVAGSPVVSEGAPPPLPDLHIYKLSVNPENGQLRIHVGNFGMAAWMRRDIVARVTWRDGSEIGEYTWEEISMPVGGEIVLSQAGLSPDPATGVCVKLDPNHEVQEEWDQFVADGIVGELEPYCSPLPDLSVENVAYNRETAQLKIQVRNRGRVTESRIDIDGVVAHEDLVVWIVPPEGRPITNVFNDFSIGANETKELDWSLNEVERERMRDGYTLTVNPTERFPELDITNNSVEVPGTAILKLVWMSGFSTFCETVVGWHMERDFRGVNTWQMGLTASVVGQDYTMTVANWTSPETEIKRNYPLGGEWCVLDPPFISEWFEVGGDEYLTVNTRAELDISGSGFRWFDGGTDILSAADDFGGTTHVPSDMDEQCYRDKIYVLCEISENRVEYQIYGTTMYEVLCGTNTCRQYGREGDHPQLVYGIHSEGITEYCWWTTGYRIYRQEE